MQRLQKKLWIHSPSHKNIRHSSHHLPLVHIREKGTTKILVNNILPLKRHRVSIWCHCNILLLDAPISEITIVNNSILLHIQVPPPIFYKDYPKQVQPLNATARLSMKIILIIAHCCESYYKTQFATR